MTGLKENKSIWPATPAEGSQFKRLSRLVKWFIKMK